MATSVIKIAHLLRMLTGQDYLAMPARSRDKCASEPGSLCVVLMHAVTSDHCASDSSV